MSSDEQFDELSDDEESLYSDKIDSDVETELYGLVHHETNLSSANICLIESEEENVNSKINDEVVEVSKNALEDVCKDKNKNKLSITAARSQFDSDICNYSNLYTKFGNSPLKSRIKEKGKKQSLLKNFLTPMPDMVSHELHTHSGRKLEIAQTAKYNFMSPRLKKCVKPAQIKRKFNLGTSTEDSSDSDCIALTANDKTSTNTELITNLQLAKKINIVDFDSSSNDSLSSKMFNSDNVMPGKNRYGLSDPWCLAVQDRNSKGRNQKYFTKNRYYCTKCHRTGHPRSFCTAGSDAICHYCGGAHSWSRCRNSMCGKCKQTGHLTQHCHINDDLICDICNMKGHLLNECPDMWRRYHLTTDSTEIVEGETLDQRQLLCCFNCGQEGHFGPLCKKQRPLTCPYPTWSSVIAYRNPDTKTPKRKKNKKKKRIIPNANQTAFKENGKVSNKYLWQNNEITLGNKNIKVTKSKGKGNKAKLIQEQKINFFEKITRTISQETNFPRTPKCSRTVNFQGNLSEGKMAVGLTRKQQRKKAWCEKQMKQRMKFSF